MESQQGHSVYAHIVTVFVGGQPSLPRVQSENGNAAYLILSVPAAAGRKILL
jgi:hypothetical protein